MRTKASICSPVEHDVEIANKSQPRNIRIIQGLRYSEGDKGKKAAMGMCKDTRMVRLAWEGAPAGQTPLGMSR